MDKKDGRRSRVPAGTFGASQPPPPPAVLDEDTDATGRLAPVAALEADDAGARKRISTLVGHPTSASQVPGAPVFAPPKWRGARAYLEGEEPQPFLSSIPTPPPVSVPAGVEPEFESERRRVTTKVGQPPPAPPPVDAVAVPEPPLPAVPTPAAQPQTARQRLAPIGDAIQQMLDGQASVPMQVDEPSESTSAREASIEEIPIDEILESFAEPDATPQPAVVHVEEEAPAVPARAARQRTFDEPDRSVPVRGAVLAAIPLFTRAQSANAVSSVAGATPRTPDLAQSVEPTEQVVATPPAVPVAAPSVARAAQPRPSTPRSADAPSSSSLAPAEVRRSVRAARQDRSRADALMGTLLVAAMTVIGVGGWFWTKQFDVYPGPPSSHATKTPPVQAAAVAALPSTPGAAAPSAAPAPAPTGAASRTAAPPSGAVQSAQPAPGSNAMSRRSHAPSKLASRETRSAATSGESRQTDPEQEAPVLRVVPRSEGELPDIPSKGDVLAALARIRPAVNACARGMQGTAQLDITVADTGFVASAVVGGDFSGTPEGSCIARAVRTAQFAPFKKPRFRLIYPFSL